MHSGQGWWYLRQARWVEGRILGVLEEGKWRNDAGHLVRVRWRNTRTHRKVTWPVLISIRKAVWITSKLLPNSELLVFYALILKIIDHLILMVISLYKLQCLYIFSIKAEKFFLQNCLIVNVKKIHLRIFSFLSYVIHSILLLSNSQYLINHTLDWVLFWALYRYYLIRSSQQS